MLRGYRCIFVVAAGLALLGASPSEQGSAQSESPQTAKAITEKAAPADLASPEQPVAARPDEGCEPGNDDRKSDLCAQWKAADAAYDGAWWAGATFFTALVGLILGAATMGAAIAAAIYAKRAAIATERTVDIATESAAGAGEALAIAEKNALAVIQSNEIAFKAQRPWLSVEIVTLGPAEHEEGGIYLHYHIVVKNHGSVAAVIASTHFGRVKTTANNQIDVEAFTKDALEHVTFTNFSLAPGQSRPCAAKEGFDLSPNANGSVPQYWVGVAYQEPNAKKTCATFALVHFRPEDTSAITGPGTYQVQPLTMKSIMT